MVGNDMDTEPSDPEIVRAAIEALLLVVGRSADDLREFHDVVSKVRLAEPPFPRVAVATTQSIIDHLKKVEEKLQEVIVALGLPQATRQGDDGSASP
jgi:hypothetical protein